MGNQKYAFKEAPATSVICPTQDKEKVLLNDVDTLDASMPGTSELIDMVLTILSHGNHFWISSLLPNKLLKMFLGHAIHSSIKVLTLGSCYVRNPLNVQLI